jgi:hypothetical protein
MEWIVQVLGPQLMKNQKPLRSAKKIQLLYNTIHLVINIFLLREAILCGWMTTYSFRCQSVDFSHSELAMRVSSNYSVVAVISNLSLSFSSIDSNA